ADALTGPLAMGATDLLIVDLTTAAAEPSYYEKGRSAASHAEVQEQGEPEAVWAVPKVDLVVAWTNRHGCEGKIGRNHRDRPTRLQCLPMAVKSLCQHDVP